MPKSQGKCVQCGKTLYIKNTSVASLSKQLCHTCDNDNNK